MAVAEDRVVHEAELARVRIECRWRVLCALTRRLPAIGSAAVEAAVDQAWMEIYEWECRYDAGSVQRHWERLAYLRAQNGIRERRLHLLSDVDALGETAALSDGGSGGGIAAVEAARTDARVAEIVRQVGGDGRRWLEATLDDPGVSPRVLAQRLGWAPEKLKSVARRTRGHLREFLRARASGAVCERRQAVMDAFAATHLAQQHDQAPGAAGAREPSWLLGSERYEQVALHIAGCEECERSWRTAERRLLRVRHALFLPLGVTAKVAGAGALALAAARHPLGALGRLCAELRMRVGLGVGRASAGGAAGGAGTAGVLAGKGAVVCVGLVCAAGAGTAALVGLPVGIVASRTVAHHRHGAVVRHAAEGGAPSGAYAAAMALAASEGRAAAARSAASDTRGSLSGGRAGAARASGKPARPVTPGELVATSSTTSQSNVESQPSARAASASGSASRSEVSVEYPASTGSSSSRPSSSSASKHGPCVPGSLSC